MGTDLRTQEQLLDEVRTLRKRLTEVEEEQEKALLTAHTQVLEAITADTSLAEMLEAFCRTIEGQSPSMLCSILLLDEQGTHLLHGAAPSLPEVYNQAIHGAAIGAQAGSCGTAAY